MTSAYTHRITVAVPESIMDYVNHLALLIGESAADINTFQTASYQDEDGNLYAVACAATTQRVIDVSSTGTLPQAKPYMDGIIDIDKAQAALDSLGQPGGMMMIVDVDPQTALAQMGLTPVSMEGEI